MIVVVMGVVGAGKTTVGQLLAQRLGWVFADADEFHPATNVEKIRLGHSLSDEDRQPWLAALHEAMLRWEKNRTNAVMACSALKRSYRQVLETESTRFVYLKGDTALISARLGQRRGHFATDSILKSQFADLEEPDNAVTVAIDETPAEIVDEIIRRLKLD